MKNDVFDKIDKIYTKSDLGLDYDYLEKTVEKIVNNYTNYTNYKYEEYYELHEIIKTSLDFAKTLGEEYYNFFINQIFNDKIITFDFEKPYSGKLVDKDNFPIRNQECIFYDNNDYRIYIPITHTLEDVYTIIHEISHTIEIKCREELSKNIFVEVIPIVLEKLLSRYLRKSGYNKNDILTYEAFRQEGVYSNSLDCLFSFVFINIKKKYGTINHDNFLEYTKGIHYFNYIDLEDLEDYFKGVSKNGNEYLYYLRYIVGDLVAVNLIAKEYDPKQIMNILNNFSNSMYTKEAMYKLIIDGKLPNEIKEKFLLLQMDIDNDYKYNNIFKVYKDHNQQLNKKKKRLCKECKKF